MKHTIHLTPAVSYTHLDGDDDDDDDDSDRDVDLTVVVSDYDFTCIFRSISKQY